MGPAGPAVPCSQDNSKGHVVNIVNRLGGLVLLLSLAACGTFENNLGQPLIDETAESLKKLEDASQVGNSLAAYRDLRDEAARTAYRNNFISNRSALIDYRYIRYIRGLSQDKRVVDAATEAATMTLGVAAAMVGGTQAKENLGAAIALLTGGKAIVDKNFYDNKALPALFATMEAERARVLARLIGGSRATSDEYPLDVARHDLARYERAGSIDGAFEAIRETAGEKQKEAAEDLKVVQASLVRNVDTNLTVSVRDRKIAMSKALLDTSKLTVKQTHEALLALGVPGRDVPASLEKQAEALRGQVRNARTDPEVEAVFKVLQQVQIVR